MTPPTDAAGLSWQRPGDPAPAAAVTTELPPQVSAWLPDLLEALLPRTAAHVRDRIARFEPQALASSRLPGHFSREILQATDHVHAQSGLYADTLAAYALKFVADTNDDPGHRHLEREWRAQLTAMGRRGGDAWATREWVRDLREGPVAVHEQATETATLVFELTDAWTDVRRATAVRSLVALGILSEAFDVRLQVDSAAQYASLCQRFAPSMLPPRERTDTRESAHTGGPSGAATDAARQRAIAWATQARDDTGPVRILYALAHAPAQTRTVDALTTDETVACARDSVYPYVRRLDSAGLVTYDRSARDSVPSRVTLTPAGVAAAEYIDASAGFRVRDPFQTRLADQCIDTHNAGGSTVGRRGGGPAPVDVEAWLAEMPDPETTGRWTRWLDGPAALTQDAMHHRQTAPLATGADVALADAPITDWVQAEAADARGSYVSVADGELLTVVQYALDPMLTLARLAASVTSRRVLARCLTDETVGAQFDELFASHDTTLETVEGTATRRDHLIGGLQLGWLDDETATREALIDRWQSVRDTLLAEAASLGGRPGHRGPTAARQACFTRLHGLLASATALLYAAGYETVVNLRVPQTATLRDDAHYRRDFLDFCRYTIPKQALVESTTGWHAWFRQVADPEALGWDTDKLRSRLPLGESPTTHLTTKWVITGPDISTFHDQLRQRLRRERTRLRVDHGGPPLRLDIAELSRPDTTAELIDTLCPDTDATASTIQACRRLFAAATNDCSPHLIARVLRQATHDGTVSRQRLRQAAATVPPDRLLPTCTTSVSRLFALLSGGQWGRTDACDALEIHPNTYDRALATLQALGLVADACVDGYPTYTATLERWWDSAPTQPPALPPAPASGSAPPERHHAVAATATPVGRPPPVTLAAGCATGQRQLQQRRRPPAARFVHTHYERTVTR